MRSRDLIDGFNYGEYMQRQMFCFGSSDDTDSGADSQATYSGGLDFSEEDSITNSVASSSRSTSNVGGGGGGGYNDGTGDLYGDEAFDLAPVATAAAVAAGQLAAAQQAARQNLAASITAENVARAAAGQPIVNTMASPYQSTMTPQEMAFQPSPYENVGYDPVTGMPYGLETVVAPDGQLVTKNLAGLTEAQRQGLPLSMKIAGMMGSNPYAYEIEPVSQRVIGQIGTPGMGLLGQGIDALTNLVLGPPKTFEDLLARGAYTGMNAPDMSGSRDDREEVKPVDPVTGQCDAGYIFDEDLQACRLDTRGGAAAPGGVGSVVPPTPGGYARMGLLDVAPTGLPQFQQQYGAGFGTPQDFAAANLNFRRTGAVRRPYPGYSLLT